MKQNGYTVYSASVAPGPFALTDLSISGADGGDLLSTVLEADGQNEIFTVPYIRLRVRRQRPQLAQQLMLQV